MLPANYEWIYKETAPAWTLELAKFYGVQFAPGHASATIDAWEKEVSAPAHFYYPWCGLTEAVMMRRAGITPPPTFLRALAWADWGFPADKGPEFGDILVFTWTSGSDKGGSHVTEYVGEDENDYHCLGGNQSHLVNIERFPKSELHAARRPLGHLGLGKRMLNPNGVRVG